MRLASFRPTKWKVILFLAPIFLVAYLGVYQLFIGPLIDTMPPVWTYEDYDSPTLHWFSLILSWLFEAPALFIAFLFLFVLSPPFFDMLTFLNLMEADSKFGSVPSTVGFFLVAVAYSVLFYVVWSIIADAMQRSRRRHATYHRR